MALQAALLPSTLSVPKKKAASLSVRAQVATAPVATPGPSTSSMDRKKTLRQGVVVITGASSGLGLAAAKALAETGKWHVVMACRDFLKAATADGSYTHPAPGLGLPRQRAAVRRQLPPRRDAAGRARLQRRHLPPDGAHADVHGGRVRDERGRQPPGPLPPRAPPPRRPQQVRLPVAAAHHPRLHHGQHQHAGRERAAQGRAGRPPGARRRAVLAERVGDDRRRQGVQGQQDLQHADDAGAALARRRASPSRRSTPGASPPRGCSASTSRSSGCCSRRSRSSSPKASCRRRSPASGWRRWSATPASQSPASAGAGTRTRPPSRTSCRRRPATPRRPGSSGRSARSSSASPDELPARDFSYMVDAPGRRHDLTSLCVAAVSLLCRAGDQQASFCFVVDVYDH